MGVLVRQRSGKTGWWVIAVHRGKRKYKRFNDRKAAQVLARQIERDLGAGKFQLAPTGRTLTDYFESWLAQHVAPFRKPSTLTSYRLGWERYLKPALGDKPLDAITRSNIRDLVATMVKQGLTRNTIRAMLAPLSTMFTRAIDDGLVKENPALRVLPRQRGQEQSKKAHPLTREQSARLLAACQATAPQWYPLFLTFLRAGLRVGEAIALQWGDVDFHGQFLFVRRQWHKGKIVELKGGRQGQVDLSPQLARVLAAIKPLDAKDMDLVFPSSTGTPFSPYNLRNRVWVPLLKAAELPPIRLHDLRHTFATQLLSEGADLLYVQRQLRHHSVEITQRFYSHVSAGYRRDVRRLDDVVGSPSEEHVL